MAENVRELLVKYKADISELQLAAARLETEVKRIEATAGGAGNAIGQAFTKQVQQVDILSKRLASLKVARDQSQDSERTQRLNVLIETQGGRIKKLSEFGGIKIIDPDQIALIDVATKRLNQLERARDASTDPSRTQRLNELINQQASQLQRLSVIKPAKIIDPAQIGIIENLRQRIERLTLARDKSNDPSKITRYNDLISQQQERLRQLSVVPAPKITADLEKQIAGLKSKVNPLSDSFKHLGQTIIAAFAVDRIVEFGKEAVQAFAAQEKSRRQLLNALEGQKDVQQRLIDQAEELKNATATDDDTIIGLQTFLATQGRTEEQIKKTTLAAIEFAAVTGDDVQTVLRNLDATFEGNIGRLGRFDKRFTEFTKTELANGAAVDLINSKYRGFAEGTLNTTAGQLKKIQLAIDDFKKKLGEVLVLNVFPEIQKGVEDLTGPLKELFNTIGDVGKELGLIKDNSELVSEGFKLIGTSITIATAPLQALFTALNFIATGFKNALATGNGFLEAVKVIFENLKTIAVETGRGVGNIIGGIFTFDRAQIARGIAQASTPFKEIGKQVGDAFEKGRLEVFKKTLKSSEEVAEQIRGMMKKFGITAAQAAEVLRDEAATGGTLTDEEIERRYKFKKIVSDAKKVNESLEKLRAHIQALQDEQEKLTDPHGADAKRNAEIIKDIKETQAKIDEITQKSAQERAKKEAEAILEARKQNSKKLLELDEEITEDLNKARAKSALEQLAVEKEKREKELQITFDASQKTKKDQEILNDDLIKLRKEFGIKEREIIRENEKQAAQERQDAARAQIEDINSGLQEALSALDTQQTKQTVKVKRDFVTQGDFSPDAERKLNQDLLDVENEFDKKRLDARKKFVIDFLAANERLLDSIEESANIEKQQLSEDLFSGQGLFDVSKLVEFGNKVVKIDKKTAEERKKIAKDTRDAVSQEEKGIADNENKLADQRLDIEKEIGEKRIEIEKEIADTIIAGTEQIIQQSLDRRSEEQIKSIESVRDAQLESIDAQIDANKKLGENNAITAKEERRRNEELLRKKKQDEDRAADAIAKIKRKQFLADQLAAVAKIGIATAVNITEFPAAAALYAALGIAQTAIVLAKPNPYKAGTKKSKKGLAKVGEEGEELMYLPEGAKVVSHPKTKKNERLIDAMIDDTVEPFIQKVFVQPQLEKQKIVLSQKFKKESPLVTKLIEEINKEKSSVSTRVFKDFSDTQTVSHSQRQLIDKEIRNIERYSTLMESDVRLKKVLDTLQIFPQLKQAEAKYKKEKEKSFADNIANSFATTNILNGQLTANEMDWIRRKGNYIRNSHTITEPIVEAVNNIGKKESYKR